MPLGLGNLEIVFPLLKKIIIFYMQMTIVKIEFLGQGKSMEIVFSFDKWGLQGLVLDPFNINLYELLEKVIIWQSY